MVSANGYLRILVFAADFLLRLVCCAWPDPQRLRKIWSVYVVTCLEQYCCNRRVDSYANHVRRRRFNRALIRDCLGRGANDDPWWCFDAGNRCQAVILFWPLRRLGIRYRPDFQWRNSGLGAVGRAGSWVLALMLTGMIPIMILLNIAAGATQRAIDAGMDTTGVAGNFMYTIAFALYSLPTSLVTISIITAVFPRMSRAAARDDSASVRADISVTIRTVGAFNILASALIFVLAVPVAKVVTPTSTPAEAWSLAWVLSALTLGLVAGAADSVLIKVFYAYEDTRTAFFLYFRYISSLRFSTLRRRFGHRSGPLLGSVFSLLSKT